jgi:hypothetical protein
MFAQISDHHITGGMRKNLKVAINNFFVFGQDSQDIMDLF